MATTKQLEINNDDEITVGQAVACGMFGEDAKRVLPPVVQASPLVQIIGQAVAQKADIATLERLLDLQLRFEANEAKKAFVQAMNAFKANPPTIRKNKHVKFGQTEYDHATLDHVCDEITQALSQHGITHRWTVEQGGENIRVTCILTHEAGHSESTTLEGPADNSGSKNKIQAIASTTTYLQRYTLLAATGLAAGTDNDANTHRPALSEDVVKAHIASIQSSRTIEELHKNYAAAYKAAKEADDEAAKQKIENAKNVRKAALQ